MKLKSYVYFVERPDGVLIRGADRSFVVAGAGAYPKVARLLGLCDGRYSKSQLRGAVAAEARPWFDSLVAELEANRFVLSTDPQRRPHDKDVDVGAFADTLAYLSDWHDAPEAAFAAWRRANIALIGDGELAAVATRSLGEFGVGHLAADGPADVDLVLIVLDALPAFDEIIAMARHAGVAGDAPVIVAGGYRGSAVVSPILPLSRLAAIFDRIHLPWTGIECASETSLTIAAGLVAIEALHHVASGASPAAAKPAPAVLHVSAHGMVERHIVPAAYLGEIPATTQPESWAAANEPVHDALLGLFEIDHEAADRQMPLHLFGLRARFPLSRGGGYRTVLGWGATEEEAAYRAHVAAVGALAGAGRAAAVCRDGARLRAAFSRAAIETGDSVPLAGPAGPGGRAAMLARLLRIYSGREASATVAASADGSWWTAAVEFGGTCYRCTAEQADMALAEILGGLVAAFQSGWDGEGPLDTIPRIAALPPTQAIGDCGDAIADLFDEVDPILRRLGWYVAFA